MVLLDVIPKKMTSNVVGRFLEVPTELLAALRLEIVEGAQAFHLAVMDHLVIGRTRKVVGPDACQEEAHLVLQIPVGMIRRRAHRAAEAPHDHRDEATTKKCHAH